MYVTVTHESPEELRDSIWWATFVASAIRKPVRFDSGRSVEILVLPGEGYESVEQRIEENFRLENTPPKAGGGG